MVADVDRTLHYEPLRRVEEHTRESAFIVSDEATALGVLNVVVEAGLLKGDELTRAKWPEV